MGVYALGSLNHSLQTLLRQYIFGSIPFGRRCLTVDIFDMTEGGHDEEAAAQNQKFRKKLNFLPHFHITLDSCFVTEE